MQASIRYVKTYGRLYSGRLCAVSTLLHGLGSAAEAEAESADERPERGAGAGVLPGGGGVMISPQLFALPKTLESLLNPPMLS